MRLKNQELLRATRPSHAVTHAFTQPPGPGVVPSSKLLEAA